MNWKILEVETLHAIRSMPDFPFKTGHLKWDATFSISHANGFDIIFDVNIAHYIPFLELGTGPHLITNAFGRDISVMHPGSHKHVGFISQKAVNTALNTICTKLGGKRKS